MKMEEEIASVTFKWTIKKAVRMEGRHNWLWAMSQSMLWY